MHIIKNYGFHRRDFKADMECENCGHIEQEVSCYDDDYFHQEVIPNMKCKQCGEKSGVVSSGARYDDSVVM